MGIYKTQPSSMEGLKAQIALLDHINKKSSEDLLAGGQGGRWMTQQQDKAKADSASKLDSYLKMSKAYPGMKPPQGVRDAGNTMMAGPMGQIGSNYGIQPKGTAMPSMSPGQAQRQSKGKDIKSELNAKFEFWHEKGKKLGLEGPELQEYVMSQISKKKTGDLTTPQTNKISNNKQGVLGILASGGYTDSWGEKIDINNKDEAYRFVYSEAIKNHADPNDLEYKQMIDKMYPDDIAEEEGPGLWDRITSKFKGKEEAVKPKQKVDITPDLTKGSNINNTITKLLKNRPGFEGQYKQAQDKGYTDEQIVKFILMQEEGNSNEE